MFRIGTTSYIIPADILPNVEYLAPLVDDVELVLFETDEYGSNLPDAALCVRLNEIAHVHNLTYTVHLPLDLRLGDEGDPGHISRVKAERVIAATRNLAPFAYTVHLDGRPLMAADAHPDGPDAHFMARWQASAVGALEMVVGWLDDPSRLCIENVEAWNPDAFAPVLDAMPVSRTVDVGHLWLRGEDPLPRLASWIDRTRVVHLHGVAERDHKSLVHVPAAQLDPIVAFLVQRFTGVVTLEVFSQEDFLSSQAALAASLARRQEGIVAKELILILGGARSGKSSHAQRMALDLGGPDVLFVATAEAYDDEMRVRIAAHQAERPAGWRTIESPRRVAEQIAPAVGAAAVVLVDCLTLLASNALLSAGEDATPQQAEAAVLAEVDGLLAACRASDATWIMVSNEVGLGLVPPYPLGRLYRDALGRANQRIAAAADRVLFMVAGLPLRIK